MLKMGRERHLLWVIVHARKAKLFWGGEGERHPLRFVEHARKAFVIILKRQPEVRKEIIRQTFLVRRAVFGRGTVDESDLALEELPLKRFPDASQPEENGHLTQRKRE